MWCNIIRIFHPVVPSAQNPNWPTFSAGFNELAANIALWVTSTCDSMLADWVVQGSYMAA